MLRPKQKEIAVELLGQNADNLGARVSTSIGLRLPKSEMGVNLAHGALGALNAYGKWQAIDSPLGSLSLQTGIIWVSPRNVWGLPEKYRDDFGDIQIVSIPLSSTFTVPATKWLLLNMLVGYTYSRIWGEVAQKSVFFAGGIGGRQFYLRPSVNVLWGQWVHLFVRWRMPLIFKVKTSVLVQYEIDPGFVAGVRSAEWVEMDTPITASYVMIGFDVKISETAMMTFQLNINGALNRTGVFDGPVAPSGGVRWIF